MTPFSKNEPKKKRSIPVTRRDRRPVKKRCLPMVQKKKKKYGSDKVVSDSLNEKVLATTNDTLMEAKQPAMWFAGTPNHNELLDNTVPAKKSNDSAPFTFKSHRPSSLDTDWLMTMRHSPSFDEGQVPSPPPFLRSVAQVLPLSIRRCSDHYPIKMESDYTTYPSISPLAQSTARLSACSLLQDNSMFWADGPSPLNGGETKCKGFVATGSPCSFVPSPDTNMNDLSFAASAVPPDFSSTAANQAETTMIPAEFFSGKVVPTQFGLAMVIVPSTEVSMGEYNETLMQMKSTRNKRWTQMEDDLLKYAVSQNEPPYPWQAIAQNYFPTQRSANQVRRPLLHTLKMYLIHINTHY